MFLFQPETPAYSLTYADIVSGYRMIGRWESRKTASRSRIPKAAATGGSLRLDDLVSVSSARLSGHPAHQHPLSHLLPRINPARLTDPIFPV
jgi:hypothetical protein